MAEGAEMLVAIWPSLFCFGVLYPEQIFTLNLVEAAPRAAREVEVYFFQWMLKGNAPFHKLRNLCAR